MNFKNENNQQLQELADRNGVAIILVDENSAVLGESNNNSMCRLLYDSAEFSASCAEFCGRAFERVSESSAGIEYKCYAGLTCAAVPLKDKKTAAIVGRVFLKAEDYRGATDRTAAGDWRQFPPDEFFGNTLFSNSPAVLENVAVEAVKIAGLPLPVTSQSEIELPVAAPENQIPESESREPRAAQKTGIESFKLREWRSLFGSLSNLDYQQAYRSITEFVEQVYRISGSAWLERRDNRLETVFVSGELRNRDIYISVAANDARLVEAVRTKTPLELRERQDAPEAAAPQTIWLFPFASGSDVPSALVVGDQLEDRNLRRQIVRFCQKIAPQMEILRLREQLSRQGIVERAVEKFNQSLKQIDSDDFWSHLINASAELMRSERSSLLIFNEQSDDFTVRAATGIKADFIKTESRQLGQRVAKRVLSEGKAVAVGDVGKIGLPTAPKDWLYKSASFISYPIFIGTRKIGVLNLTDQADGKSYTAADIKLLDAVMPSLAVMIDRADLKDQAGAFKQLSVTDALTGLLNRRYLEERLTEEIKRSNRHGFPMSFLMIDVDEFKAYNDSFGHVEGDKALQIVGACLRETLRGADVAARYGGEEFSILLPQTSSAEAEVIAERVRERVANECFPNRQVTVSVGIASCSLSLNSSKDLIAAADKALYAAKREGRNNVKVYGSHLSSAA